ncbi:MAG: ABC transporter permease [Trueperaceae bacterium]
MTGYFLRRLLQVIPTLVGITLLVFVTVRLSGDPIASYLGSDAADSAMITAEQEAAIRAHLGLDKPLALQYVLFLRNITLGDFGGSFIYQGRPALDLLIERVPATARLAAAALLVAILISLPGGVIAALNRNKPADTLVNAFSVIGDAMPNFWLGVMLILLFSVKFGWLPVSGTGSWRHLLLPAITLGTSMAALQTRLMRSGLIEVLNQDYVRTARAKGLSTWSVVFKHAMRNAALGYVTLLGLAIPSLLGGSVVVERIFAWPGVGLLFINGLGGRDMALIQAVVVFSAAMVILANLVVDLLYTLIDPRVRYA